MNNHSEIKDYLLFKDLRRSEDIGGQPGFLVRYQNINKRAGISSQLEEA